MTIDSKNQIAVLVDYENVPAPEASGLADILSRASREGTVVMRRAYANWARFSSHKTRLRADGFEMIEVASVNGKNGVDIKLVVDAMEIAFTKDYIDTFIIVSGDSDFIPLVVKLNELNRRAWLCLGNKQVSPAVAKFCFRLPTPAKPVPPVREENVREQAVREKNVREKNGPLRANLQVRGKIGPTIPKNYPVPSLASASARFSPAQLEIFQLAIHICDLVVALPAPLAWLFSTVRVLEPDFNRDSVVGKGKRPQVRMARGLRDLGLLEFEFDEDLGNYIFSVGKEFRLLPFPPASHACFDAAIVNLQRRVEERQDGRFELQPTVPGQSAAALTSDPSDATVSQAEIRLYCSDESYSHSPQLEFSFE